MSVLGLFLSAFTTFAPLQDEGARPGDASPNFVLFYADDLGWRDVGFMGSTYYETPHLDRLAREGLIFTDAYSNGPNCAPSRACLMSGLLAPRHGVYTVNNSARGMAKDRRLIPTVNRTDLDDSFVTLAEALGDAGYKTGHFGKWHLGDDPKSQGFDVNVGGIAKGSPPGGYFAPYKNPALPDGPKGEHLTDRLTDEAIAWMREVRNQPFFLYLPHYAVHTPIQADQARAQRFKEKQPDGEQSNAKYAAMIERLDESLGRVRAALEELGLTGNTVIVFTSDNGGLGTVTSMAPLRGQKGTLYEGGIRVPMVFHGTPVRNPGRSTATPVSGLDIYPTLLELAGLAPRELDGQSLVPLIQDRALADRALYWHFPAYLEGNRIAGLWRTTPAGSIRRGRYKLLEFFETGRLELYDLESDIAEDSNLSEELPELTRELHRELRTWRQKTGAPVPTELNPDYVD